MVLPKLGAQTQEIERKATNLLDDSIDLAMTPESCDLDYWLRSAVQKDLQGTRRGHAEHSTVPDHMARTGPLRSAILDEFAFRATSEEAATRAITYMVRSAPTLETMDFYATQLVDEARHAHVFRWHLIDLGLPRDQIDRLLKEIVGERRQTILDPLEELGRQVGEAGDFIGGVIVLAVIAEGALAPAAEMSERKWHVFDPPAAEICRGANRDEVRHLSVGTTIVRQHLLAHPGEVDRLSELIRRGMRLWQQLPIGDAIAEREVLFQQGIERHGHLLGDWPLVPGRPLAETTIDERLSIQLRWAAELREQRLKFMGISL